MTESHWGAVIPFLVLTASTLALRAVGTLGVAALNYWSVCLRVGLALMFLLTASAHWGKRRRDLVQMVPAAFPRPDLIVTVTGVLEVVGAIGLLVPATTRVAAVCLILLLMAMFPANVSAARRNLTLAGKAVTGLPLRSLLQACFIAGLIAAAFVDF
jgi:uncharacterized membrane protein